MAITASIAVSSATGLYNQVTNVTLTVSNSGGSAVNVIDIIPTFVPTGVKVRTVPCAIGLPYLGAGATVSVAASGSTNFTWGIVPFAPQPGSSSTAPNPPNPSSYVYDAGATVTTSDGSVTTATTTTVTVAAPSH